MVWRRKAKSVEHRRRASEDKVSKRSYEFWEFMEHIMHDTLDAYGTQSWLRSRLALKNERYELKTQRRTSKGKAARRYVTVASV